MYNLKKLKFNKFKVGIIFESNFKLPHLKQIQTNNLNPLQEVYNLGLNFKYFTLKKKNKIMLTTLTSPHVHKKSREQYKIDYYKSYLFFHINNIYDYKKFLQFKIRLYQFKFEQGLHITLTYFKLFSIQGILPFLNKNI
jgi:hypothetical protein